MAKRRKGINEIIANQGGAYVTQNITFFIFLAVLGLIYISNSHLAMKRVRKINRMTEVIKQKRWYYIQGLSDVMQKKKLSRVKKDVEYMGLKELITPPQIIVKQ